MALQEAPMPGHAPASTQFSVPKIAKLFVKSTTKSVGPQNFEKLQNF